MSAVKNHRHLKPVILDGDLFIGNQVNGRIVELVAE